MPHLYFNVFIIEKIKTFLVFDIPNIKFNNPIELFDFLLTKKIASKKISREELEPLKDNNNLHAIPLPPDLANEPDLIIILEDILFIFSLRIFYSIKLQNIDKLKSNNLLYEEIEITARDLLGFLLKWTGTRTLTVCNDNDNEEIKATSKLLLNFNLHQIFIHSPHKLFKLLRKQTKQKQLEEAKQANIVPTFATRPDSSLMFRLQVTNGPHIDWGNEGRIKFWEKVIQDNPDIILCAGFSHSYSFNGKLYPPDTTNCVFPNKNGNVYLGDQYAPSRLVERVGKLFLFVVTLSCKKQFVLYSATADTGFAGNIDFYSDKELRFLLKIAGILLASSETPNKQLIWAHCRMGLNRSPAFIAMFYVACLAQSNLLNKTPFDTDAMLKDMRDNIIFHLDATYPFVNQNWEDQVKNTWQRLIELAPVETTYNPDLFTKKSAFILKILQSHLNRVVKRHRGLICFLEQKEIISSDFFKTIHRFAYDETTRVIARETELLVHYVLLKDFKEILLKEVITITNLELVAKEILKNQRLAFLHAEISQFFSPSLDTIDAMTKHGLLKIPPSAATSAASITAPENCL